MTSLLDIQEENSVLLALRRGWYVRRDAWTRGQWHLVDENDHKVRSVYTMAEEGPRLGDAMINLYDHKNMHLAWDFHLWAMGVNADYREWVWTNNTLWALDAELLILILLDHILEYIKY